MPSLATRVELQFGGRCRRAPQGVHVAPGRAVLLGQHLEAAGGTRIVAPLATGVACAWGIRPDSRVVVWGMNARQKDSFHHDRIVRCGRSWSDLARGACAHVAAGGARLPGIDLMVQGDLPIGEGLASSAAYLVVILRSLHDAIGSYRSRWELAEDVPAIEAAWLGHAAPAVDAYAVAAARGSEDLLVIDPATLEHETLPRPAGHVVVTEASGEGVPAADDAAPAHAVAAALASLRRMQRDGGDPEDGADPDTLVARVDPDERGALRYALGELARVRAVRAGLATSGEGDAHARILGQAMTAGERSLARDLDASSPAMESLVALALARPRTLGIRAQGHRGSGQVAILQPAGGGDDVD